MKHDALGMMLIEYLKLPRFVTKACITIEVGEPTRVDLEYLAGPEPHADKDGNVVINTETLLFPHYYEPDA